MYQYCLIMAPEAEIDAIATALAGFKDYCRARVIGRYPLLYKFLPEYLGCNLDTQYLFSEIGFMDRPDEMKNQFLIGIGECPEDSPTPAAVKYLADTYAPHGIVVIQKD